MLYIITGPPAAGKTTWVKEHAKHGDITIDFDDIANALTPTNGHTYDYPNHIINVTHAARNAVIDHALRISHTIDVYLIHSAPTTAQHKRYTRLHANIIEIDPGPDIVLERCKQQRPPAWLEVAKKWYIDQSYIPI